jgi:DNA-binding NtrC family response regulator
MALSLRNKVVLVIDDDIGMFPALTKVLASEGCTVAGATDPTRAVEYILNKDRRFDLIITDLRMPGLDGTEVLDLVKQELPGTPVIIITAFSTPEAEAKARKLGVAAFLEKPVASDALLETIRRALSSPRA